MLAVVFGRFLGVLILVPGRYLKCFVPGFSFLVFGSWALLVRALLVLGIAGRFSSGPGGFRLTRLLRVVAGWGVLGIGGSVREVCAGGEDILLSKGNGRNKQVKWPYVCAKRSEREQGREMKYKKV